MRRRGGVPPSWTRRLRRTPGVTAVARTARTQVLLRRSRRAGGRTVDAVPQGYAIPLDVLVVQPRRMRTSFPQAGREIRRLRRDTALLSRTSARLRRLGVGDRLSVAGGRELRVAGIVDDELVGFAELVLTGRDAGGGDDGTRAAARRDHAAGTGRAQAGRERRRADPQRCRRLRSSPRLIARPLEIKARFGEFAVRPAVRRRLDPHRAGLVGPQRRDPIGADPRRRHLQPAALFAPLRRALRTLERRGLSSVVDRADYAGCFAPRRIPGSGSLSLHAWGLAIDINAAANPRLGDSRQDRRLVRAMEDAGFTWGGRWPTVPDPMHFELHP